MEDTQQLWAQEAASTPSGIASFRRQSSLGLRNPDSAADLASVSAGTPHGDGKKMSIFSPKGMLTRRVSSFAQAQEDIHKDEDGGLHLKSLKVVPPEFQKPVNERAKLTFYEIMSDKNDASSHLPSLGGTTTDGGSNYDSKPLFSPSSGSGNRSPSFHRTNSRPTTSPLSHHRTSKVIF